MGRLEKAEPQHKRLGWSLRNLNPLRTSAEPSGGGLSEKDSFSPHGNFIKRELPAR